MVDSKIVRTVATMGGWIASVIVAFLWLDARHDEAGAALEAEKNVKLYLLEKQIADLEGRISRYNAFEELGQLDATNAARREQLILDRQNLIEEMRGLNE